LHDLSVKDFLRNNYLAYVELTELGKSAMLLDFKEEKLKDQLLRQYYMARSALYAKEVEKQKLKEEDKLREQEEQEKLKEEGNEKKQLLLPAPEREGGVHAPKDSSSHGGGMIEEKQSHGGLISIEDMDKDKNSNNILEKLKEDDLQISEDSEPTDPASIALALPLPPELDGLVDETELERDPRYNPNVVQGIPKGDPFYAKERATEYEPGLHLFGKLDQLNLEEDS
jgi:hypothetical protein